MEDDENSQWWLYMLECADGSLYTGITNALMQRVHAHNHCSTGAKYTRARRPVRLVYQQAQANRSAASKAEFQLKQRTRVQKLQLIAEQQARLKGSANEPNHMP